MSVRVYLAGPIVGCSESEAKDWRAFVSDMLDEGIVGVSPLRCEPAVAGFYKGTYDDPLFGTLRAIRSKNIIDVQTCDVVLAYLPKSMNTRRPSYGTTWEIGMATAYNKPVVVVTDDPTIREHPAFGGAPWVLPTLTDAVVLINSIYAVYT